MTYDPATSTRLNYGRSYPDLKIVGGGHEVVACPALAGAIPSLKLGGYECIYSLGHGAAMGWNVHPSPPGINPPPPSGSELYNPTQHGQNADDYRNLLGMPIDPSPSWPLYLPQMHGPSTSLIDPGTGGWFQGPDHFCSRTRMAYYVRTGWPSSYEGGQAAYPNPPHLDLSRYRITQRVGFLPLGGWQVIKVDGKLQIDPGEPPSQVFNAAYCAYLLPSFTRFWRVPVTGARVEVTPQAHQGGFGSGDPIIASTQSGDYALGMWAPPITGISALHFGQVDDLPFQFQIIQVTFYHQGVTGPGEYPYRVYVAAGNLDWVEWLLKCARGL